MGIDGLSNNKYSADAIFNKLDEYDGKDGKITGSVWNKFAKMCGAGQINNSDVLVQDKAMPLIKSCLSKATICVMKKINWLLDFTDASMKKQKEAIASCIENEAKSHYVDKKTIDMKYWSDLVYKVSKKYNIPPEIVVAILSKESNGTFNISETNCENGSGPMQMTTSGAASFHPTEKGNWYDLYNKLDPKLTADTVGTKENPRYTSARECKDECAKDAEYGTMAGILKFKGCYVDAVGMVVYGSKQVTWANTQKALNGLQNGTIKLTNAQKEECMRLAFEIYNGADHKKSYAESCMQSLKGMNFDFNKEIIPQT